ncbi:MAG: hypothetical protein E7012_06980 [Alphaproteobacteria bacterium]|nr:hypothetical protein [Alphaproteobacteria bacterium]
MDKKTKIMLNQVLQNNLYNPIILVGLTDYVFENTVVLSADIDARELNVTTDWCKKFVPFSNAERVCLQICGLDKLEKDEQMKFVGLLKDRRIGSYKLPDNVQIVVLVDDLGNVSERIKSLVLVWNA